MTLSGALHETGGAVAIETVAAATGGLRCRPHVTLESPDGIRGRTFEHARKHAGNPSGNGRFTAASSGQGRGARVAVLRQAAVH
ncbi:hypothetical protein QZM73_25585 [Burkholderia seminalis]|nr:hypothetical protein [Burkholderia seminalis]MDN7852275.1 hypothetical protein [Burkholderia seminalis]